MCTCQQKSPDIRRAANFYVQTSHSHEHDKFSKAPYRGFGGSAYLIGYAENNAFAEARQHYAQREHMRKYHVFLDLAQLKIAFCVIESEARVTETVQTVAFIAIMPIVQKIIMQQSAAYKRTQVYGERQQHRKAHTHHRNGD